MGENFNRHIFKDFISSMCEFEYQAELLTRYIEKMSAAMNDPALVASKRGRQMIAGHRRYKRGVSKVKAIYGVRRTPDHLIIVSKTTRMASYLFDETAKLYSKNQMPCRYFPHILRIACTYQNLHFITDAAYERHYQYGYHNAQFVFGEEFEKRLEIVREVWG